MATETKERPSGCGCGGDRLSGQRRRIVPEARGTVVEIGIGSGENLPFYDAGRVERLTGVDPSRAALRQVSRRAATLRFPVDTVRAAAESLPLANASADAVVMTYTLCTVRDPSAALSEIRRVLKPGGQFLFCEHGAAPDAGLLKWQRRLDPLWALFNGGCHLDRPMERLIAAAGFRFDRIERGYVDGVPKIVAYDCLGLARREPPLA